MVKAVNTTLALLTTKTEPAWLPLIVMPPGSAEASMVRFLFKVKVPLDWMVAPERLVAKVMVSPLVV